VESNCTQSGGPCVTFTYEVTGIQPDHVAGLMPTALEKVTPVAGIQPNGTQTYPVGDGDPIFELGKNDVSRAAFKVNPSDVVVSYKVHVAGTSYGAGLVPVKIKKGKKGSAIEGACALAGPAVAEAAVNPFERVTTAESGTVGPCSYTLEKDESSGEITVNTQGCSWDEFDISQVQVFVNNEGGPLQFSEGFSFVAGNGTCAFRQFYPPGGPVFRFCW
jgi:hypothetical protein